MNVCPSCGTLNPDSAKFCLECGTRLIPSVTTDSAPPAASSDQPTAPINAEPSLEADDSTADPDQPTEPIRPKKDVSGLPPSWMPAPVTLSARPTGQRPAPATPPVVFPPIVTTTPAPNRETPASAEVPEEVSEQTDKDVTGLPPSWMPTPVDLGAARSPQSSGSGLDPDWKMSDPGPLPGGRDRRLWLWIPVGLIAAVLICCVAFFIWATTIGSDTVDGWATNAAVNQTEEAVPGE